MKVEHTQNGHSVDEPKEHPGYEPDELGEQRDNHRKHAVSSRRPILPDPPDPDNLPIDYPGPLEIDWP